MLAGAAGSRGGGDGQKPGLSLLRCHLRLCPVLTGVHDRYRLTVLFREHRYAHMTLKLRTVTHGYIYPLLSMSTSKLCWSSTSGPDTWQQ